MAETPQTTEQTSTPPAPWYQGVQGVDDALIGRLQTRGWDKKTPTEVAVEAVRAHTEAERLIGAPASEVVRLPKAGADPKEWDAVWQRMGKPVEAKGYDLTNVKFKDGTALDSEFSGWLQNLAHKNHLPVSAAQAIAAEMVGFFEAQDAKDTGDLGAKLAVEKDNLAKSWGPNANANLIIAQNAVKALGVDKAAVDAFEGQVGYAAVMEMFRKIGKAIGEDRFIQSAGNRNQPMTREEAQAQKQALMNDKLWVDKYQKGDREAREQMLNLNKILVAGQVMV